MLQQTGSQYLVQNCKTLRVRSIYYHLPISDHVYSVIKQQIWGALSDLNYRMNNVVFSLLQLGDVRRP